MRPEIIDYVYSLSEDDDRKQNVLLYLLENDVPDDLESAKRYIQKALKHDRIDEQRQENLRQLLAETFLVDVQENFNPTASLDPIELMEKRDEVLGRLNELSPLLAHTVRQLYFEGRTVSQLAEKDGIEPNAIYQRLNRVRSILDVK